MNVPKGWCRERVLISGTGSTWTAPLRRPAQDVVFAEVVDVHNSGLVLSLEGLNTHHLTKVSADGLTITQLDYCFQNVAARTTHKPYQPPVFQYSQHGKTHHELVVRWLTLDGALDSLMAAVVSTIEIDLWRRPNYY
jgi:hypothetical protein